jgi:ankyrin repeat protein
MRPNPFGRQPTTAFSRRGRLAIHLAAASTAPVEVLQLLLAEAHPDALLARDDGGSLPLHLAVARTEPDLEVVQYLVRERPEAVRERDNRGFLPLHVAVSTTRPSSTGLGGHTEAGILKALVDATSRGAAAGRTA